MDGDFALFEAYPKIKMVKYFYGTINKRIILKCTFLRELEEV
jgi:hypothetical protein